MKRGRRNLLILLACGVVGLSAALLTRGREPIYEGRKLSEWLEAGYFNYEGLPSEREAAGAVRHIGTNALPYLLGAIQYEHSASRKKVIAMEGKVPAVISRAFRLYRIAEGSGDRRAEAAAFGFRVLGPDAGPAVPELTRLLSSTNSEVCERAMWALARIGKEGIPPLVAVLEDRKHASRDTAASCMNLLRDCSDVTDAVPVLVQCMGDRDRIVAWNATRALGMLTGAPEACVPALVNQARNTNATIRVEVARSLGRFGKKAQVAIPSLVDLLSDSDVAVRQAATNAVRKIAPEVLGAASR